MIFSCPTARLCKLGLDPIAFTLGTWHVSWFGRDLALGGLRIHWYGIFIAIGLFAGIQVALRDAPRRGVSQEALMSVALWCAVAGVAGGRLYYVVQNNFLDYLQHPQNIIAVWQGGMAFYGAIFGGALAMLVYSLQTRISLWKLWDLGALGLAIGQAFGRVGNIINGDIVGYPTDGTWGIIYTHPNALAPVNRALQPAAAYELLFSLALFIFLWGIRKRVRPDGMLAMVYLVAYSLGQLALFVLRDNVVIYWGLKQAQITALVVIAATLPFIAYLASRSRRSAQGAPAGHSEPRPREGEPRASPSAPGQPDA